MKQLFLHIIFLGSLASCSHNDPTPTPTLVGGKWTLQTETNLATPKDGTPASTSAYPVTEQVTLTFLNDTNFSMDIRSANNSIGRRLDGAYTYQAQTLAFPAIYGWPTPFIIPKTVRVIELSAHTLVTEYHWKNVDVGDGYYTPTDYVTTDTYSR